MLPFMRGDFTSRVVISTLVLYLWASVTFPCLTCLNSKY